MTVSEHFLTTKFGEYMAKQWPQVNHKFGEYNKLRSHCLILRAIQ